MNHVRVLVALTSLLSFTFGCAEPAQLGGLGVLNPNGLEGRMALAGRVNGTDTEPATAAEPSKNQNHRSASQGSEHHDAGSR